MDERTAAAIRAYLRELVRPWKLASFALGMAWLIYGALNYGISDWNMGDSLVMGSLTYLCASWSVRTLLLSARDRPRLWPLRSGLALLLAWAVVDGSYVLYNSLTHHQMYRLENLYASTPLYFLAGFLWSPRSSLQGLVSQLRAVLWRT
jgi:hypothetical protein